ncbi:hypothetical protein G7054_g14427 [Neopestalotiopsis clavispora]|nr:hypothetical protein G7054_g14427 [Neopestalotiopsis clavispora]
MSPPKHGADRGAGPRCHHGSKACKAKEDTQVEISRSAHQDWVPHVSQETRDCVYGDQGPSPSSDGQPSQQVKQSPVTQPAKTSSPTLTFSSRREVDIPRTIPEIPPHSAIPPAGPSPRNLYPSPVDVPLQQPQPPPPPPPPSTIPLAEAYQYAYSPDTVASELLTTDMASNRWLDLLATDAAQADAGFSLAPSPAPEDSVSNTGHESQPIGTENQPISGSVSIPAPLANQAVERHAWSLNRDIVLNALQYNSYTHSEELLGTAYELADRVVYLLSQTVNYCSKWDPTPTEPDTTAKRIRIGEALITELERWKTYLGPLFQPLPTADPNPDSVFQPLWIHPPKYGVALQIYSFACILITLHRPAASGFDGYLRTQKTLSEAVATICGIAMELRDEGSQIMSAQCLFGAGLCVQDTDKRNVILSLIDACEMRTGWPMASMKKDLLAEWAK